jgi:hypothetical protein
MTDEDKVQQIVDEWPRQPEIEMVIGYVLTMTGAITKLF